MMSVEEAASVGAAWGERLTLCSYTREVPALSLLETLRLAQNEPRTYWKNDLLPVAYAGYGTAAILTAEGQSRIARIQLQIDHLYEEAHITGDAPRETAPRLFGGFAFAGHYTPSGIWSSFPSACFILPRVQFTQMDGKTWLTVSRNVESDVLPRTALRHLENEADDLAESLACREPSAVPPTHVKHIEYPLALDEWRHMISEATQRIHTGELHKVVLSRVCDVEFADTIEPACALENLDARYPDCYRFLLEVEPGHAFFGATPELIAEVHDSNLHTMALAGSRPRGATPDEDETLAQAMMDSPKDRQEHALVVDALRERVKPYARTLDVPDTPTICRLRNIQHLYSPVRAELETHFDVLDLVGELHPTPALGGTPRRAALEAIEQLETEERGWYAAPVGWVDANGDGVFAVAIRSAISDANRARLYAGVGIVADSDPDQEWDETGWKFRPLLGALGVPDAA
jgi:menaquinone-specific isochorismate synthase